MNVLKYERNTATLSPIPDWIFSISLRGSEREGGGGGGVCVHVCVGVNTYSMHTEVLLGLTYNVYSMEVH